MARNSLFRKNIEPRCGYCARAGKLNEDQMTCKRRGIVSVSDHCFFFKYDALRRVPPKPAVLRGKFEPDDFLLGDCDEKQT